MHYNRRIRVRAGWFVEKKVMRMLKWSVQLRISWDGNRPWDVLKTFTSMFMNKINKEVTSLL